MWVTAYTDASYKENISSATWALWIRSEKGRIVEGGKCPVWVDTSAAAELYAAYMGVKLAVEAWPETVGVFVNSDCEGILRMMWPWSPAPSRESMCRIQKMIQTFKVKIRTKHVKGHQRPNDVRAYLNNQVDKIAGKHHA